MEELKGNYDSTVSKKLKKILSALMTAKKWTFILVIAAMMIYSIPVIFDYLISQINKR